MRNIRFPIIFITLFFLIANFTWTWSGLYRLTWTAGDCVNPAAAIDSTGTIHLVYQMNHGGSTDYEIYYKKSTDKGGTWSPPLRLTCNSGESLNPAVEVDPSNRIHISWVDNTYGNDEILYKRSGDGGTSFSSPLRMTWTSTATKCPVLAVNSSGTIYLFWTDKSSGRFEIYFKSSSDGGVSWSANNRVTWFPYTNGSPDVAVDANDEIHLFYGAYTPPYLGLDIYYKKSSNSGSSWTPPVQMTYAAWEFEQNTPHASAVYSNDVHMTWRKYDFNLFNDNRSSVFYKFSTDGGANWAGGQRLTWSGYNLYEPLIGRPDIAIDSIGNPHIIWSNQSSGNHEIYYDFSTDGGSTWKAQTRLTWNPGDSTFPIIVIDNTGSIHIFWADDTTGTSDIYYKNCDL